MFCPISSLLMEIILVFFGLPDPRRWNFFFFKDMVDAVNENNFY